MSESKDRKNRLSSYNNHLKRSLKHGFYFTRLMDQLITTSKPKILLSASKQLANYHLNTHWIKFPYQYRNEDYELIFMTRLLAEHHNDRITLSLASHHLVQVIRPLNSYDTFTFDSNGNYLDSRYREKIFHLDLDHQTMNFNNQALIRLLVVHYYHKVTLAKIKQLVQTWMNFGRCLMYDYGFKVLFGILNPKNAAFYRFQHSPLSSDLIDELFVTAARHRYMLKSYFTIGAQLPLSNHLDVRFYVKNRVWGLSVHDSSERVSWLDILLRYNFIRSWYLGNLKQLRLV